MLLDHEHLDSSHNKLIGWICRHCLLAQKLGKRPAYSLANDLWTGDVPPVLTELTLPERLLIAIRFPQAYVVKLFLKSSNGTDHPLATQTRLKGNVTTYHANVEAVEQMLKGELMPQKTSILPTLIAITFIGRSSLAKSKLKSLFWVRRKVVSDALWVLKSVTKHPGYVDLKIDKNTIEGLPEDEVPEEIYAAVQWDGDEGVAIRESAGYVPPETEEGTTLGHSIDIQEGLEYHPPETAKDTAPDHGAPTFVGAGASSTVNPNLADVEVNLTEDPDIIPLEFSGIAAADETQITPNEILRSALKNLSASVQEQITNEGPYIVRRGGFARDFGPAVSKQSDEGQEEPNPSAYTFPHLFPYGVGGLEDKREVPISFVEHTRCLLQRRDFRFRKDSIFAFWALSLEQKRQALQAAQLTMARKDFDRICASNGQLKADDYRKAVLDEEKGVPTQDPKIEILKKSVRVTMQKVMGSDVSRAINRSKIWSTSLWLNPVNLWITLNFIDRHDPICQVFAGEKIDMDNFSRVINLSAQDRAINVGQDPFAATQFFFFLAKTVLKTLLGFTIDNRIGENEVGELGKGSAYFGAVEAQGRGSLHLHLMMWLANSPDADEITHKLQSSDFREKIKAYMRENIWSHLDGLTEDTLDAMEPESALAWGRPPDPDSPNYENNMRLLEIRLAGSQQYHKCTPNTCQQYNKRKRRYVCKRRAPFELSHEDVVTELGEVRTKRLITHLNNWCPTIFYGGRCNNDIKFITNGAAARAIAWYITNYTTKKQGASYNQSAVLEKTYAYHAEKTPTTGDIREQNRQFIFRCGMSLNREMEFSGQQAMAYLMGYGDTIHSHTYVTIWWSAVISSLKKTFPELAAKPYSHDAEGDQSDVARVDIAKDNIVYLRSQVDDYRYRAAEFESTYFLEYFVDTYEERIKKSSSPESNLVEPNDQPDPSTNNRGRRQNSRGRYLPEHPRAESHQRVVRTHGHRTLPDIVGPWFQRRDDPETYPLYCASVLAALKPWRELTDLKNGFENWDEALDAFLAVASSRQKSIQANMQYYYQCQESANQTRDADEDDEPEDQENNEFDLQEYVNGIELDQVILSRAKQKELEHAERAAEIGLKLGVFGPGDAAGKAPWTITNPSATTGNQEQVMEWTQALHIAGAEHRQSRISEPTVVDAGDIEAIDIEGQGLSNNIPEITYEGDAAPTPGIDTLMLSTEQLRAFEIVKNHLLESQAGNSPEQLLMQIQGEGGTGKSLVISKITEFFGQLGKASKLRKSAYTGIAASLIEGSTLHQLALLHHSSRLSKKSISRLQTTWQPVEYLIIDEVSMVSKSVLADISRMVGIGKQKEGENNSTLAFGGINVIIAGDFHQFPPVIGGAGSGALYSPTGPTATMKMITGRTIYEQFRTVVILKKQFRVEDEKWRGVLTRARQGTCTPSDIESIRELILDPTRDQNLLTRKEWADAVLVTSRHAVRNRWNELASYNHCRSTGQQLFMSRAYDTHNNNPLDMATQTLVRAQMYTGKAADGTPAKGDAGGIPDVVYVAVGMKVMVTYNIETELDVANGARGTVIRIITGDSGTVEAGVNHLRELSRPPICVLVKLWRTKLEKLPGLDEAVIPIVPIRTQFQLKLPNKKVLTISREQLPLTPAYAFTDYRSQGQTIPYIIMDLATPPTGGLTPFNGYVTLSRSRTSETARLLRDFDEKLFTTPPSKHLASEDKRLEELDLATANRHHNVTGLEV